MHDTPEVSEFSGVAGQVLRRAISLSSLVTGLTLFFLVAVGNWVLIKAGTPGATTFYTQILFAFAMSRFALNGLFGEWGGTVFSTEGGPWSAVAAICARYLMLTALWLVPLALLAPGEEQFAALAMLGPAAAGKVLVVLALYVLAMVLTPPIFLIVATRANEPFEPFSPDLWRATFGGRLGDLFVVYAVYAGGVAMVCVLSLPVVLLGFASGRAAGTVGTAAVLCLLFGVSANLLGRLCGFFACGDLGLHRRASSVTPGTSDAVGPAAARGPAADIVPPPLPGKTQTAVAGPAVAPRAPAVVSPGIAAPAVAVTAHAPQRPPLLDAQQRVAQLMQRFDNEPSVVLSALEDLHHSYAPSPAVQQALVVALTRSGRPDEALALGQQALPLCFERGNIHLAAAIFRDLAVHATSLGLSRDNVLQIAAALHKMGDLGASAKTYTLVLGADPGETRAIKGLLQVGDQILEKGQRPDQAAKVYRYLLEHCGQSPLAEYMRRGLDEAERRLRGR